MFFAHALSRTPSSFCGRCVGRQNATLLNGKDVTLVVNYDSTT